jgi:mono/diheme cytochrome c family protein
MGLKLNKRLLTVITVIAALILLSAWMIHASTDKVDFTTQVKPIINQHCISCHGGVRQKGGFSLLFRDEALAKTKDSIYAIIPGDPDHSELMRRITLNDPEDRMPYKHDPLSKDEIDIFRRWIKEGAPWGDNWSYVPLKPIEVPEPTSFFGLIKTKSDWAKNPVDNFIEQKLKEEKLEHSPQADKATLLRRVSFDIIGMQPDEKIAQKFLNDSSDHAYEELVDSLLASSHYGEKWAGMWLDLARYADTKGYERDDSRNIWRYRDWVINAFNSNMPYDSFLIQQIGGDLLPNPTDDDYIATAFHRNTMTNDEGGTDNEEFRTAAVMDRVSTTWNAVMGTTFACVQCHSHPYDPFRHDDYYKFMAFFNDTRDEDTYADYPLLRNFDDNDTLKNNLYDVVSWLKKNVSDQKAKETYTFLKTWQPSYNSLTCDSFTNSELNDTKWTSFRNHAVCRLKNVDLTNKDHLIFRYVGMVNGGVWQIHLDDANGEIIANISLRKTKDWKITETDLKPASGVHNLIFTYTNSNLTKPVDAGALLDWLYFTQPFPGKDKEGYADIKNKFWKVLTADVSATPVMMDDPPDMHRASYVFERGNWLIHGDKVSPDVPQSLNPFPANAPRNRLGLAEWITSKQNPLTARTMVNRVWEQFFGQGLAETLEDLGTQGISPTHPELLDWLSYKFMNDDRWNMKQLIKTIVMSATYQQSSVLTPQLKEKDPQNKYYARGPRVRLSAEEIRDQSLCIAGLMSNKMYGPGVMPYQPKGIWLSPWNSLDWVQSKGDDQYRRAIYTYWKRSAAYPAMVTFDIASREVCSARRINTNTPLQSLTTLNDSSYIDAARHFAFRMQSLAGNDVSKQIATGFKLATYQNIDQNSLHALLNLYNKAYMQFKNDEDKTCQMLGGMDKNTNAETAALTVVANAMLNLDEVVTKN